eukprot:1403797-Rhodomonas_salina.1
MKQKPRQPRSVLARLQGPAREVVDVGGRDVMEEVRQPRHRWMVVDPGCFQACLDHVDHRLVWSSRKLEVQEVRSVHVLGKVHGVPKMQTVAFRGQSASQTVEVPRVEVVWDVAPRHSVGV